MKLEKTELSIFLVYAVIFGYALITQFTKISLPFTALAVPVAITVFVVFVIHMLNILVRSKQ